MYALRANFTNSLLGVLYIDKHCVVSMECFNLSVSFNISNDASKKC